ncbi:MAG: EAL domain-containing protein [Clostridia bacterium]|nr:EAL domain-containing protein [Clostridia bacterium]
MNSAKKLIGVCLSQAHTFLKTDFLVELDNQARKEGYSLVVFNSSMDYYWAQKGSNATGCVYSLIRYDLLATLVILAGDLYDTQMQEEIIHKANRHKIPVIWQGGIHDNCISMPCDYQDAFKELIRHVVRDHGAEDTFFMAGIRGEVNSQTRLRYWQEVMEEEGLPFGDDRIAYGNYVEKDARLITEKMIRERKSLPRAIFCANDGMAAAVCSTLKMNGIRVPEDVIVTGFDGTATAWLSRPRLSTCDSDYPAQAELVMDLIRRYSGTDEATAVHTHRFRSIFSESCGCPGVDNERIRTINTLQQSEMMYNVENTLFYQVEQLQVEHDLFGALARVAELLLPRSALYLNKSILNINPDTEYQVDHPEEELIMVPYCQPGEQPVLRQVYLKDMPIPYPDDDGVTVLNIVHAGERVCGYFAAHSENLSANFRLIKRVSDVLNMVSSIQLDRIWRRQLEAKLENNLYTDFIADLPNLKGLTRWYDEYTADPENHRRILALTIFGITNYSACYETFGMAVTEEIVKTISHALCGSNPQAIQIARISEDQFAVMDAADSEEELAGRARHATETFFKEISEYNSEKNRTFPLEVNHGYTKLSAGWDGIALENMIHLALGEMYLNRLRVNASGQSRKERNLSELYTSFNQLMEENLFRFYFQPIIDVRSGTICAYEALMRTASPVNLNPMEILSAARESGRLYDVDKVTIFGIINRYVKENAAFRGRKIFINTIPGYFLNEEDCAGLTARYQEYLDCFTFELLEDSPISDEELARLKKLCKPGSQTQVAIDDYGTGHSNIINLLRYAPQIIKIDRGLITGIENDHNRRLFVQNTIDFAHQNGIKALAEGVETLEELNTVIECGVDLIQGFFTGRPSEKPAEDITDEVRNRIVEANLQVNRFNKDSKIYFPKDGEEVSVIDLALQKYTSVLLRQGSCVLNGDPSHVIDFTVYVADGAKSQLTLNNVSIKGIEEPTVRLGDRGRLDLILLGKNTLDKEGILVPASASLTVRGDGDLKISNTRNYAVGIGSSYNDPYGTIQLLQEGTISIQSSGDKILCLGGGWSAGEGILSSGGSLELKSNGVSIACLGSYAGAANIDIRNTKLSIHGDGNEVLLAGSRSGEAKIRLDGCELKLSAACELLTGIGTMSGNADAVIANCTIGCETHCDRGAVFGSFDGGSRFVFRSSKVRLYGEGYRVSGFGSLNGTSVIRVESGEIDGNVLAVKRLLLGNNRSRFVVTGGNIRLAKDNEKVPVSPAGLPLCFTNPGKDHYEAVFRDQEEEWTYVADRNEEGYLGVWILL